MRKRSLLWSAILLGMISILLNSALVLYPAEASDCSAQCIDPKDGKIYPCSCSGSECKAKDGEGCSATGSDGSSSKCSCGKKDSDPLQEDDPF